MIYLLIYVGIGFAVMFHPVMRNDFRIIWKELKGAYNLPTQMFLVFLLFEVSLFGWPLEIPHLINGGRE